MTFNRVTAAALGLTLFLLCACEPTLERRVFEYERQINAGNVEGVVDLYTEDATVEMRDTFSLTGKEALRALAQWDSVLHTRLTFHDIVTEGDTVLANVSESNDWLSACGIEELIHPTTLIMFRDGLIYRIESETDTAGTNAIRRSLDAVLEWGVVERPQVIRKLMPDAGFRYNAESAHQWLRLLQEWKTGLTTGPGPE